MLVCNPPIFSDQLLIVNTIMARVYSSVSKGSLPGACIQHLAVAGANKTVPMVAYLNF